MSITPEAELMILLECAEDSFPVGRVADFEWHAKRPGQSSTVDLICGCQEQGWVTLHEVLDQVDGRMLMRARLTPAGQHRIAQLSRAGVQPSQAVDADDYIY